MIAIKYGKYSCTYTCEHYMLFNKYKHEWWLEWFHTSPHKYRCVPPWFTMTFVPPRRRLPRVHVVLYECICWVGGQLGGEIPVIVWVDPRLSPNQEKDKRLWHHVSMGLFEPNGFWKACVWCTKNTSFQKKKLLKSIQNNTKIVRTSIYTCIYIINIICIYK